MQELSREVQIWRMMVQAVELIRNRQFRSMPRDARPKPTLSQLKIMGCIFFSPSGHVKVKDIAQELGITPGGVSQIVDTLLAKGVVRRDIDENDRRAVRISLSEKGEKARHLLDSAFEEILRELFDGISAEDTDIFFDVLSRLNKKLQNKKISNPCTPG